MPDFTAETVSGVASASGGTEEDAVRLLSLLSESQRARPSGLDQPAPAAGDATAKELRRALERIDRLEACLRETQADRDEWRVRAQSADQYCVELRSRTQRAILLMIGLALAGLIEVIARA